MKQRFIRAGDDLSDGAVIVVRGGHLDRASLRIDALRNNEIYGTYGVSVFAVKDITFDELAQQVPLVRFGELTLIRAGVLRAAGLRLDPTGRNPRHYDITFDDLDDGVNRLSSCEYQTVRNPYHDG